MFFKREEKKNNNFLSKVCALLIYAAKIDEEYSDKEEEIIKKTLLELGANKNQLDLLIINSSSKENSEIKLVPEMLNLLGCSKDNFKKLLQKMNYKIFEKENETFFKYSPTKKFKKITTKKISNENPFKILKNLNLS